MSARVKATAVTAAPWSTLRRYACRRSRLGLERFVTIARTNMLKAAPPGKATQAERVCNATRRNKAHSNDTALTARQGPWASRNT